MKKFVISTLLLAALVLNTTQTPIFAEETSYNIAQNVAEYQITNRSPLKDVTINNNRPLRDYLNLTTDNAVYGDNQYGELILKVNNDGTHTSKIDKSKDFYLPNTLKWLDTRIKDKDFQRSFSKNKTIYTKEEALIKTSEELIFNTIYYPTDIQFNNAGMDKFNLKWLYSEDQPRILCGHSSVIGASILNKNGIPAYTYTLNQYKDGGKNGEHVLVKYWVNDEKTWKYWDVTYSLKTFKPLNLNTLSNSIEEFKQNLGNKTITYKDFDPIKDERFYKNYVLTKAEEDSIISVVNNYKNVK